MIAEIITVGTEITIGDTLDTNTHYIARKLLEIGIESHYHTTVDDSKNRLENVIKVALNRSDLIVITGGLGPTEDDLTKEAISTLLKLETELDEDMLEEIKNKFLNIGRVMTSNNKKQAVKPRNASFIHNSLGTAPGIYVNHDKKDIILLPGPPQEMKIMYENEVVPLLDKTIKEGSFHVIKSINTVGIGESDLETKLLNMNLINDNINIRTFAGDGTVEIKIIGKGINNDKDRVLKKINYIIDKINNEFELYIYSFNNQTLENYIVNLLNENNYKMGLAESCTGGLISSMITSVSGASSILNRGIVSYSNESKKELLSVNQETLKKHGAVSKQTAYEMAKGLFNSTNNLDIVLSITGIAGPTGDSIDKPVGLVYICVMNKNKYKITKYNFRGSRTNIQKRAAISALDEIRKFILNYH